MKNTFRLISFDKPQGSTSKLGIFVNKETDRHCVGWFDQPDGVTEFDGEHFNIVSPFFDKFNDVLLFHTGFIAGWERA